MAQALQQVSLNGMGFQGLNTELSPINFSAEFALVADNLVIDQVGRLGSREAFKDLVPAMQVGTENFLDIMALHSWYGGQLNSSPVLVYLESQYRPEAGQMKQDREWTDPLDVRIHGPDATKPYVYGVAYCDGGEMLQANIPNDIDATRLDTALFVNFKEELLLFSAGNPPLKYDGNGGFTKISGMPDYTSPEIDGVDELNGDVACSAYGRLWVSGVNGDYQTSY